MKNRIISTLILLSILLLTLSGCDYFTGSVAFSGNAQVVVEESDGRFSAYEVDLFNVTNKKEGAVGVVNYLAASDTDFTIEMNDTGYGAYVTGVNSIEEDSSAGMYVIVYTSRQEDSYQGSPTYDYEGTTLYQAGVGLSSMRVEDGTVILFRLEKSPY